MDTYEYSKMLKTLSVKIHNIENIIKPADLQNELTDLQNQLQSPTFWNA